jgi:hypothetical protein
MTARQQAIEAAARAIFREEGPESIDEDGAFALAAVAVDAVNVPALLNDLADRIAAEEAPSGTYAVGDATFALGIDRAAALVRAWAAKGWTE